MSQVGEALKLAVPLFYGCTEMVLLVRLSRIPDLFGVDQKPRLLVTVGVVFAVGHNGQWHPAGGPAVKEIGVMPS